MKSHASNEQLSDSISTKQSEKIYPFCISLVSSSIKELENEWNSKLNNNNSKKKIIKSLFSILNFQILLIQQISKYYNLYIYNSDEDNINIIKQIINLNKDLINKKIGNIININIIMKEKEKENKEIINEEKIFNYKISKYKKDLKNEIIIKGNKKTNEKSFKRNIIKNYKKKILNKNNNNKIKKVEYNTNNISSNKSIFSEKKYIDLKKLSSNQNLKRTMSEKKEKLNGTPNCRKIFEESEKIKINLANKFPKNNDYNDNYTTLSNLRRHSKNSLYNNLCLTQSTFNYKKAENTYTIPVEENPVRKVKNIILNAKNSLLLIKTNNTPTNMNIFNRNRYTTFDNNNRRYLLSEEINKGYNSNNKKLNKNISFNGLSKKLYDKNKQSNKEILRSMSNMEFFNNEKYINYNKNVDYKYNNNKKIVNKERKCIQILKDGMKKIEKRINSKNSKNGFHKN